MFDLDRVITAFDNGVRTLFAPARSARSTPGEATLEPEMTPAERHHAAALMRVNHTGEICAQALYQGQSLTARNAQARAALEQAAAEETDHLAWTAQRISELGGRASLLNPLWYAGSFAFGAAAGLLGDKWNLGFLAETERQVEGHLAGHLDRLPPQDEKSRAIINEMKVDEARHARTAVDHGAAELPEPVKAAMKAGSRIMTGTTYWI
jgi:ubiquinone biosynthesis monooxygenase Coq7